MKNEQKNVGVWKTKQKGTLGLLKHANPEYKRF